jgi:hypothetical protein
MPRRASAGAGAFERLRRLFGQNEGSSGASKMPHIGPPPGLAGGMIDMMEKLLAALTLLVCLVLLLRLFMGERWRQRSDAFARRTWGRMRGRVLYLWYWRESRRRSAQAAEEAIRRARVRMERDGNVYRPDAFQEPRKPH